MESETPLYVRVARALHPEWTIAQNWSEGYVLLHDKTERRSAMVGEWIARHGEPFGTQFPVPKYDSDWEAAGMLIDEFKMELFRWQAGWGAELHGGQSRWTSSLASTKPQEAICHCVLNILGKEES